MDDIQQKLKNVMDMAARKDKKRQQPSPYHQRIMAEGKFQSQKRQQPNLTYQQDLQNARKENEERQQPSHDHQRIMADGKSQSQKRQQPNENRDKKGNTRKKTLNPLALLGQVNLLKDTPYFAAMISSLIKEIFDIILSFTFIMPIIFSLLNVIFGIMMMQLAKFSEKEKVRSRLMVRVIIYFVGSLIDGLPGISMIPMSILTTLIVYFITLYERANAEKTEKAAA